MYLISSHLIAYFKVPLIFHTEKFLNTSGNLSLSNRLMELEAISLPGIGRPVKVTVVPYVSKWVTFAYNTNRCLLLFLLMNPMGSKY